MKINLSTYDKQIASEVVQPEAQKPAYHSHNLQTKLTLLIVIRFTMRHEPSSCSG